MTTCGHSTSPPRSSKHPIPRTPRLEAASGTSRPQLLCLRPLHCTGIDGLLLRCTFSARDQRPEATRAGVPPERCGTQRALDAPPEHPPPIRTGPWGEGGTKASTKSLAHGAAAPQPAALEAVTKPPGRTAFDVPFGGAFSLPYAAPTSPGDRTVAFHP